MSELSGKSQGGHAQLGNARFDVGPLCEECPQTVDVVVDDGHCERAHRETFAVGRIFGEETAVEEPGEHLPLAVPRDEGHAGGAHLSAPWCVMGDGLREGERTGAPSHEEGGDVRVPVVDGVHHRRHPCRVRQVDRRPPVEQLDRLPLCACAHPPCRGSRSPPLSAGA